MVLFVTMVVLAVAIATTVTVGHRQRAHVALAVTGLTLWAATAAGLAIISGVHPVLLALVGVSVGYAVHHLTRRALDGRAERHRPTALFLAGGQAAGSTDETTDDTDREPPHWSVIAAAGTAATALEGYWAYQHQVASGGVFSDLSALVGFTVLATLTVGLTGVAGLAVHMRSTPRIDSTPQPMPAPSDMPTIAFAPLQPAKARRRSKTAPAAQ